MHIPVAPGDLLKSFVGRPTPLTFASASPSAAAAPASTSSARTLPHGAHKINNALGQGSHAEDGEEARHRGDGAGQHGVATATVAALLG